MQVLWSTHGALGRGEQRELMADLRIGILTCSDSRAAGEAEDLAGRAIIERCEARGWLVVAYHVCPFEFESISSSLIEMSDVDDADVIVTLGGTGLGPGDITPEVTERISERLVPGIAERIRAVAAETPSAGSQLPIEDFSLFSRATAGIRGQTLILNLPGGTGPTVRCFDVVADHLERASSAVRGQEST